MLERSNKLVLPWERSDQGSALELALFSIFINDLEKGNNNEMAKFADDTNYSDQSILQKVSLY